MIKQVLAGEVAVGQAFDNDFYDGKDGYTYDRNWDSRSRLAGAIGLKPSERYAPIVRELLLIELKAQENDAVHDTLLRYLCCQLFHLGEVTDSVLIWRAKTCSFDTHCGIDVQLLCGAGLEATRAHLQNSNCPEAPDALKYLNECVETGDFKEFDIGEYRAYNQGYYGDAWPDS